SRPSNDLRRRASRRRCSIARPVARRDRRTRRRQRTRRRPLVRVRDVLGDPLGADPGLRSLGGRAGSRRKGRDAAAVTGRLAAVALARSLFRKGADFTAAMAFEFASTNLVIELGILMALILGWQFTLGEFVGGPLMIVLLALVFRVFLRRRLVDEAREYADRG